MPNQQEAVLRSLMAPKRQQYPILNILNVSSKDVVGLFYFVLSGKEERRAKQDLQMFDKSQGALDKLKPTGAI